MIFQLGANQSRCRKILSAGSVSLTYKISFKLISYKQAARDTGLTPLTNGSNFLNNLLIHIM